jgi:hypothetical protein
MPRYSALLRTQELFTFSGIPPDQAQLWFGKCLKTKTQLLSEALRLLQMNGNKSSLNFKLQSHQFICNTKWVHQPDAIKASRHLVSYKKVNAGSMVLMKVPALHQLISPVLHDVWCSRHLPGNRGAEASDHQPKWTGTQHTRSAPLT